MKRYLFVVDLFCAFSLLFLYLFGKLKEPTLLAIIILYLMRITVTLEQLLPQSATERTSELSGAAPPHRH